MADFIYQANDESATEALGTALAGLLKPDSVVGLTGTLGAGKTFLIRSVAAAHGVDRRQVVSPTFVLLHEYEGRTPIYHFDAYRIKDATEFRQLGPDEYYAAGGLVFIEWAERIAACLPPEWLEISIVITGDRSRAFEFTAHGRRHGPIVGQLAAWASSPPEKDR